MTLTLDAELERRIQRRMESGFYREPAQVIERALDLLEADESWSEDEKAELDGHLSESMAQIRRGEGLSGERARAILAERLAARRG